MKRILFVASLATLLAAGCQKTEIINPVGGPSLSFTTGMGKLTKAEGTADADGAGESNLQAQDFRVWAYCAYDDTNTTDVETNTVYDGMEMLPVTYQAGAEGSEGTWSTEQEYYWPGVNKNLKFFAVSSSSLFADSEGQTDGTETVTVSLTSTDDSSVPSLSIPSFTVNSDSPNEDLMVADFVEQNQSTKAVDLKFRHALCKVQFVFKTLAEADAKVYVQSLEAENLINTGSLTIAADDTQTADESDTDEGTTEGSEPTSPVTTQIAFTWNTDSENNTATFEDDYTTAIETEGEGADSDWPTEFDNIGTDADVDKTALKLTETAQEFATWLMVPQSVEDKTFKVTYLMGKKQFTNIFKLSAENLTEWGVNQFVKYTITLAPNRISFNPSVEDWDEATDVEHEN